MSTTTPKFRQPLRRRVEVVKQMLRAGQLAAKLQILRQDRSRLRAISEGVHIQQMDKVTEDLRRALVQFLVMQLRAIVANLMRMRQMHLSEKACGAGAPGKPGFQPSNTCANGGGSGPASGDLSEFVRTIEPTDIEYWTGENNGHKPMADDIKDDESFIDAVKELLPGWDGSIDEAQQVVMGLAGVLDGSHVSLSRGRDNDGRMVTHVHFSSRTPDGKNFAFIGERRLYRDGDDLLIYNEEFNVHPDMQRQGIGLQMLATQAAFAQKHGVTEIETYADGEGRRYEEGKKAGVNPPSGYMVWPNLGYDAPLEAGARSKIRAMSSAPASVKKASTVSEVIATDEGRAWWEKHGTGQIMAFDPTKGSRSTRVLVKVLARKGITGAKTSTSTKTFSQPFGMRSEKRMPPGSRPITTAEGLSRSVFDPREWDKKLIETLMVPYAGAYLTAASSEIEIAKIAADRKSVDISRSKMIADYDRWKAFCPTGIGNGIDNSCPPTRGGGVSVEPHSPVTDAHREQAKGIAAGIKNKYVRSLAEAAFAQHIANGGTVPEIRSQPFKGYKAVATYSPSNDLILVNSNVNSKSADSFQRSVESGFLSQVNPVLHELGHKVHSDAVGEAFDNTRNHQMSASQKETIGREVSRYATTNALEFVAEVFSGVSSGKQYSDEVLDIFRVVTRGKVQLRGGAK